MLSIILNDFTNITRLLLILHDCHKYHTHDFIKYITRLLHILHDFVKNITSPSKGFFQKEKNGHERHFLYISE